MSSFTPPWRMKYVPGSVPPVRRCRAAAPWPRSRASVSTRWTQPTRCWPPRGWPRRAPAAAFTCRAPTVCCTAAPAAPPQPRCRRPLHRRVLCRCMTCPPAVWTRRCSRRTAGGASKKNCSTSGPSFYSAARCRATRRCGRRSPNICRCTAAWTARRNKSSSAQVLSTCWAAWRTCSMMGWRPSKTPDTPARGRSCRTAASPARWWTSTVRAYPPPRWKRAARTSAT